MLYAFLHNLLSYSQLPLLTDNTNTAEKGNSQIELSNGVGYHNQHRCYQTISEISGVYTYGLFERADIVFGIPFINVSSVSDSILTKSSGFSDLSLEFKYRFLTCNKFSMAVKPGYSLPTGDKNEGLGAGKLSGSLFLVSTLKVNSFSFNYNLGYLQNNNKCGDARNLWHLSASADYWAGPDLHLVLNTGFEKNPDIIEKIPPAFGLIGFYYFIKKDFEIGAGYKNGLTKTETKHSFILSLTCRFP